MRSKYKLHTALLLTSGIILFSGTGCETEKLVTIPSIEVYDVHCQTDSTAKFTTNIYNSEKLGFSDYGVCWSTTDTPTVNDNKTNIGTFESYGDGFKISGLSPYTKYYVRAYAINSAGIGYSDTVSITTYGKLLDNEGNDYLIQKFGTQEWMIENMQIKHYNNGDPIPEVPGSNELYYLTYGAYFEDGFKYPNIVTHYPMLYNWYLVVDERTVCPTGWHIPTKEEWTTLVNYIEGKRLLKKDFLYPDGYFFDNVMSPGGGGFYDLWWTTSENNEKEAWLLETDSYDKLNLRTTQKHYGFSFRCLKD